MAIQVCYLTSRILINKNYPCQDVMVNNAIVTYSKTRSVLKEKLYYLLISQPEKCKLMVPEARA